MTLACRRGVSVQGTLLLALAWAVFSSGWARGDGPPDEAKTAPAEAKSPAAPKKADAVPIGFFDGPSAAFREAEAHALSVPNAKNARKWLRVVSAEPHVAGTPADHKTALFVRDKLRSWGWKAEIEEIKVLLNYPRAQSLSLQRPRGAVFNLDEFHVATDKDSVNSKSFGAFNGYGTSGRANGQVVYANYGRPEDFEKLEKLEIDVKDKIVLVRYGELFRGLKVWNAQKRGARGVLIYSDPADDGYVKGDVYPAGRYRPETSIQRGSVQFLSLAPGDPSTPFGPSVEGCARIPIDPVHGVPVNQYREGAKVSNDGDRWEAATGLKRSDYFAAVPSLPIGYVTARLVLKELAGPGAPAGWQGGLPFAYHVGPGPAEAAMSVTMDYQLRPIWNVIATIPGAVEPDHWVMVGNHRDAWVNGAVDPGSGTAATLEMCRALGSAFKHGWKPRRTLVYASWDAEEYGLVGSTEWAEAHAEELARKAMMVLNVDVAVTGPDFTFGATPSLRNFVLEAAGAVRDDRAGKTLRDLWAGKKREAWAKNSPLLLHDPLWGGPGREREAFFPQPNWLGSGSDYTVFVDHLGVPAVDARLTGGYGVYHSIYDSFEWMEKFGDPEFLNHVLTARLYTLIAMRAASADIVPFRFDAYGRALRAHVDALRLIHARRNRAHAAKPGGEADAVAARPESPGEFAGLRELVRAVKGFHARARELDEALDALAGLGSADAARLADLNSALVSVERAFLLADGLADRPWFKHAVYAPGLTTGYAAWPLPAVRQALEAKDRTKRPDRLASAVSQTASRIDRAAEALENAAEKARAAAPR